MGEREVSDGSLLVGKKKEGGGGREISVGANGRPSSVT